MPRPAAPVHVASGELIDAAWGNAVVNTIGWDATLLRLQGVEYVGRLMILGGSGTVATDASGLFSVAFAPRAFAGGNPVVFCDYFSAGAPWKATVTSTGLTGFSGVMRNENGGAVANQAAAPIMWSAIGVLTV